MQSRYADNKPAIVIAAFGSRRDKAALDQFHGKVVESYPDYPVYLAYTSSIISKKTGNLNLQQTLAKIAAGGYRRAVVLPLQIFPGSEYRKIAQIIQNVSYLHVVLGETLLHRRKYIEEVFQIVQGDFLKPVAGLNIIALHGTPNPGDPVNDIYLDVEKFLLNNYDNVIAAALVGVPNHQTVFHRAAQQHDLYPRVRLIPLMFTAGLHIEDDLMGTTHSWKNQLTDMGYTVECLTSRNGNQQRFKSLASYGAIQQLFLQRLADIL